MRAVPLVAATALLAGACASIKNVPAGSYQVGTAYEVQLGQAWAELPSTSLAHGKVLTIDGPQLNLLRLVGDLEDGASLIKAPSKEQAAPQYRSGMSETELVELIVDSLAVAGYQNVEARALRPSPFGGLSGVRFDLIAATPSGLELAGIAHFAESEGRLNVVLFLAAREYYFDLRAGEVERILASVRTL